MKQKMELGVFLSTRYGSWEVDSEGKGWMSCGPNESARCTLTGEPGQLAGVDWKQAKYLYLDLTSIDAEFASPVLNFEFWSSGHEDREEPDLTIRLTCLPRVKTRMSIPLSALDAQNIFLMRTPGRFRGFVTGGRVEPESLSRIGIGLREYWSDQKVIIEDLYVSDEEPEYPLVDAKMVDGLGQWKVRDWPGKTGSFAEMKQRLEGQLRDAVSEPALQDRSRWGGWKQKQFSATGYFRIENDHGRHWLVDPDGYAFFSVGIDGTGPNIECPAKPIAQWFDDLPDEEGEFAGCWGYRRNTRTGDRMLDFLKLNFQRVFGRDWITPWAAITRSMFYTWGFNTLGNFSALADLPGEKLPYVHQLNGFPGTRVNIYRDFPDVFSGEYAAQAAEYAEGLKARAEDPCMIGYFMRNEPQWGFAEDLEISAELLRHPDQTLASKNVFMTWLQEKYERIDALNAAWGTRLQAFEQLLAPMDPPDTEKGRADLNDFSRLMIREYIRVPALALKAVDPHHLNLGMRYAFILYPNQAAGCEFMDVFSINCYKIDPGEVLKQVTDVVRMPVIIGEFHFGSIDRGLGSTGIIGVKTQKDRGLAYQRYIEACALNPYCVGAHWFTLYDQSCMGRFDGENYQIGILDVCNRPYEDFVSGIMHTHEIVYPLADGQTEPEHPEPERAKSNIAS